MKHRRVFVRNVIFALYMSLIMSFCMSGVVTFMNFEVLQNGFSSAFFAAWWKRAFPVSYMIALPISLFVVPYIGKLTNLTLNKLYSTNEG